MQTVHEMQHEIMQLSSNQRVLGYLERHIKFLRVTDSIYKKTPREEDWMSSDILLVDGITDELDPWFYALNKKEKEFLQPILIKVAEISNGKDII